MDFLGKKQKEFCSLKIIRCWPVSIDTSVTQSTWKNPDPEKAQALSMRCLKGAGHGWESLGNHWIPCWGPLHVPAGDREWRSHSWPWVVLTYTWVVWTHPAAFECKDLGVFSCMNWPVFILLLHWILKNADLWKIPFSAQFLGQGQPCLSLILVTDWAREWIQEVRHQGEVKKSLRSAVIKISPFFLLPNQWGCLYGWTQTHFLGRRLYLCE